MVLATPGAQSLSAVVNSSSGGNLVLSVNASQNLSTHNELVSWGSHDDSAAINSCIAASASGTNGAISSCHVPQAPGGGASNGHFYGVMNPVVFNPGNPSKISGDGYGNSSIIPLVPLPWVIYEASPFIKSGMIADIAFDGNKVASYTAMFDCANHLQMPGAKFLNAAPQGKIVMLGGTGGYASSCNTPTFNAKMEVILNGFYVGSADFPLDGLYVGTSDSYINQPEGPIEVAANTLYLSSLSGNFTVTAPHTWGCCSAASYPNTTFNVNAGGFIENPICDGFQQYCMQVNTFSSDLRVFGGTLGQYGSATQSIGIQIATGLDGVVITGFNLTGLPTQANAIVQVGTPPTHSYIYGNPGALDYPFNLSGSLSALGATVNGGASAAALTTILADQSTGTNASLFLTPRTGAFGVGILSTGNASDLVFQTNFNETMRITASSQNLTMAKPIILKGYTVDTLPSGVTGARVYVTDAVACTFLATPVHNGSIICPVFYNGSAWVAD